MKAQLPSAVQKFAAQEMDRKQFLKSVSAMALFVAGGGMIVQSLLKGVKSNQSAPQKPVAMGYGASTYGGSPKVASRSK